MRLHLFEFIEQAWLPNSIRKVLSNLLAHQITSTEVYAPIAEKLAEAIAASGKRSVVDLCAGSLSSVGVFRRVAEALEGDLEVRFTDKFPNPSRFAAVAQTMPSALSFSDTPVDALQVPETMHGFRTLFTAFHHFRPEQCAQILGDAVRAGDPIAAFEFTERRPAFIATGTLLCLPIVMASCLTLRPLSRAQLLWCFVVPVVPLMFYWDGFVSALRSYTPEELRALAARADGAGDYAWDIGQVRGPRARDLRVTYLIGMPKTHAAEANQGRKRAAQNGQARAQPAPLATGTGG